MTEAKTLRPFGLWDSPIQPKSLGQGLRLSDVAWDSDGETLVWLEGRSDRDVLVCARTGQAPCDLTPDLPVRARVGYGGGDFTVAAGYVYFVASTGRLYRQPLLPGPAIPLTPEFGHAASPVVSPDGRWLLFVHHYEGIDGLALVDTEGQQWPQKIVFGDDFYMQPRWHPDGSRIAWVSWDHPQMPWDGTTLKLATLRTNGPGLPAVKDIQTLAGGEEVAIFQPEFSPDGRYLAYVSDETGWGNLNLYDLDEVRHRPLTADAAEIGTPAWVQGLRTYGFSPNGKTLYFLRNKAGIRRLWAFSLTEGTAEEVTSPLATYTWLEQIAVAPHRERFAFIASSGTIPGRVITWTLHSGQLVRVWKRSAAENVPPKDLSTPQPISWTAPDGTAVHGLYYPPHSRAFESTGLPPAIVLVHGGPTGQVTASYDERAQLFATRGYAVLQVNYRGSTGYGKAYMAALHGNWGIYDVEDAVGGAHHLAEAGLADPEKLVIMGGSAGGYTVLQSLVTHPGFFKAGICLYGISNLFTLAAETHKFEERYGDSLVGPLPEASARYRERSPLFAADRITDPVAIFQGEIDRVVPKAQSDEIVASLRARSVPHVYHVYKGEGHGWRKSETIEDFYRRVEAFLKQYVLFA
jgi:dipeptidyl aminopeptidase/acylaminoacyl peptidase